jgi:uncharacterized protein YjbI with pentapeptide repeats/energy-coupling factor transporter ATP-binding protein EcfA2
MIVPQRAPVRPRVRSSQGSVVLLEDEVCALVEAGATGVVGVLGPPGSGKTTALEHLAATVPPAARVRLLDSPSSEQILGAMGDYLVVYAAASARSVRHRVTYQLAPWARDDLIEYLVARHKDRCASIMARARSADDALLQGLPDLWQIVLEELAGNEALRDVRQALDHYLAALLPDTDLQERGRSVCLNALVAPEEGITRPVQELVKPGFVAGLVRVLRHRCVQVVLATERVASDLRGEADCDFLASRLPRDLVKAVAAELAGDTRSPEHLHRLLAGPPWSHAMAASLLHALDPSWMPAPGSLTALGGAYLEKVAWLGVNLAHANLREADLSFAILSGADLTRACAAKSFLRHADLRGAWLEGFQACEANLLRANLSSVRATNACFDAAGMEGANLDEAILRHASFVGASLARAAFRGADLTQADLHDARINDGDFSGANLRQANLSGLVLREAYFAGCAFAGALLARCDLEGMELSATDFSKADLTGALMTGSVMKHADFSGARLRNAKLAEIDWEGANLWAANLQGVTFHMGSSRSGLVGSPIASEGSRTGFYTDDYEEQSYKSPEEIRKANLCGADLRGAQIEGVDFYLVDLRGALLDPEQEEHVRRCGAILEARV